MLTSKTKTLLRVAMVAGVTCSAAFFANSSLAPSANAKDVRYQTPGELSQTCAMAGGDYIGANSNGVYGCQFKGGALVSCGGHGKYAKTCSNPAPKRVSPTRTLPSRTTNTKGGTPPVVRDHRRPRPGSGSSPRGPVVVKNINNLAAPAAGGAVNVKSPNARSSGANGRSSGGRR
jgi:hypothetical protein